MAFTAFLIDQARRVYSEQAPTGWTEDGPTFATKHGPWFKCRLTEQEPREQLPAGRGVYRYLSGDAELLVGVRDLEGGRLVAVDGVFVGFDADDKLEVVKKGTTEPVLWEMNTRVEPIRRVRGKLLGFKVGLVRVEDTRVEAA